MNSFKNVFFTAFKTQRKRDSYLKITKSWEDFDKQYGKLSPDQFKELLIVSEIDKDTYEFLSNLKIKNND